MPPPARGCLPIGRRGSPEYHTTGAELSDKLYRLLDKRMHISVIVNERNDLSIFRKDLLDTP